MWKKINFDDRICNQVRRYYQTYTMFFWSRQLIKTSVAIWGHVFISSQGWMTSHTQPLLLCLCTEEELFCAGCGVWVGVWVWGGGVGVVFVCIKHRVQRPRQGSHSGVFANGLSACSDQTWLTRAQWHQPNKNGTRREKHATQGTHTVIQFSPVAWLSSLVLLTQFHVNVTSPSPVLFMKHYPFCHCICYSGECSLLVLSLISPFLFSGVF